MKEIKFVGNVHVAYLDSIECVEGVKLGIETFETYAPTCSNNDELVKLFKRNISGSMGPIGIRQSLKYLLPEHAHKFEFGYKFDPSSDFSREHLKCIEMKTCTRSNDPYLKIEEKDICKSPALYIGAIYENCWEDTFKHLKKGVDYKDVDAIIKHISNRVVVRGAITGEDFHKLKDRKRFDMKRDECWCVSYKHLTPLGDWILPHILLSETIINKKENLVFDKRIPIQYIEYI